MIGWQSTRSATWNARLPKQTDSVMAPATRAVGRTIAVVRNELHEMVVQTLQLSPKEVSALVDIHARTEETVSQVNEVVSYV